MRYLTDGAEEKAKKEIEESPDAESTEAEEKETEEELEEAEIDERVEKGLYLVRKPFQFEGKEIKELDISSLNAIRGKDLDDVKRILRQRGIAEDEWTYFTSDFCFTLLSVKSGIPLELFAGMYSIDYILLQKVITRFLLR